MSRYSSLCTAIELIEAVNRMMRDTGHESGKTLSVVQDLRDIAKDVRYGGHWEGKYEIVAGALELCTGLRECAACPYRKSRDGACIGQLKMDAAAAIRQLGKDLEEARKAAGAEDAEG